MTKIVVTAQVNDARQWEQAFRTHAALFRTQAIKSPMSFTVTGKNEIAICSETDDLETFMKVFESQATADAMRNDGVKRETVKYFVLDKTLEL